MSYATLQDYGRAFTTRELEQLVDRDQDANQSGIQQALDDATALINGYISRRYSLPLATPIPALRSACLNIARRNLFIDGIEVQNDIVARARDAVRWLESVAAGTVRLIDASGMPAGGELGLSGSAVIVGKRIGFGNRFEDAYDRCLPGITPGLPR